MSELRCDVLTGEQVAISPGRRGIGAVRVGGLPEPRGECPFCPGHEAETETTVLAIGEPWEVRVVRNRFPIVLEDPEPPSPNARAARGVHEVVIESRDHDADLATYDPEHAVRLLQAMRSRVRALEALPGIASVSLFRNRGRRAGSSQPHPHAQIVALDVVPPEVGKRAAIAARTPRLLDTLIERERAEGARVVVDADGFVTLCPFASHRAWESRIAPSFPCPRFSELEDAQLEILARRLVDLAQRLRRVLGDHDYNVLVRDPPVGARDGFVIDVLPRTGGDAGFELQSGIGICVVAPEDAARALRDS